MNFPQCCVELNDFIRESEPRGGLERSNDDWYLNGCCGGGCYVLGPIRYCPFCGIKWEVQKE